MAQYSQASLFFKKRINCKKWYNFQITFLNNVFLSSHSAKLNTSNNMKKYTLGISGLVIEAIAIGFMIYGIMPNKIVLWIALPFVFIGLAMAIAGVYRSKSNDKV